MCVIIYSPNGVIPNAHLSQSLSCNPDGWGYTFYSAKQKRVIARHGMTPAEFWKAWQADAKARKGRPTVFHSRIGTSGTKTTDNCHPFPIDNHDLWLFHNGIIHGYGDDKVNDTRQFIDAVLVGLPRRWLECESIQLLVEAAIGYSKLVLMDAKGNVTVLNEHLGHWADGRWHSNASYLPPPPPPKPVAVTFGQNGKGPAQVTGKVSHGCLAGEKTQYLAILEWRKAVGLPVDDA